MQCEAIPPGKSGKFYPANSAAADRRAKVNEPSAAAGNRSLATSYCNAKLF